jgi:ASC-1-like (ASCH) protein
MNSNPRILKLSNGDEIICMVHDTENNYLKVSLPLKLVLQYIVKKYKEFDNYSSLSKETKKIENTLSEEDKFENAVDEYCNYYYDEESKKKN